MALLSVEQAKKRLHLEHLPDRTFKIHYLYGRCPQITSIKAGRNRLIDEKHIVKYLKLKQSEGMTSRV